MKMKDFFIKAKLKLPYYKEKLSNSLDVLLVYQGLLFIISPGPVNQLLLIALIVIVILLALKKI